MRVIEHSENRYKRSDEYNKYIHFYESLEMPGYYLFERDYLEVGMLLYHAKNRTGVFDPGTGHPHVKTAEPISIGGFSSNYDYRFEWYIFDNYVEEHIPHEISVLKEKAWYKFKVFEPEKWLSDFLTILKQKDVELEKRNNTPTQLSLF